MPRGLAHAVGVGEVAAPAIPAHHLAQNLYSGRIPGPKRSHWPQRRQVLDPVGLLAGITVRPPNCAATAIERPLARRPNVTATEISMSSIANTVINGDASSTILVWTLKRLVVDW